METNFTFFVSNWKSNSVPLFYKIKYKDQNNNIVDISAGGFSNNNFTTNLIPLFSEFLLEVTDNQGFSNLANCNKINIKKNKNLPNLEDLLNGIFDTNQKLLMMSIYSYNNEQDQENNEIIVNKDKENALTNKAIDMIGSYFENFNSENFIQNYGNIISNLMKVSNPNLDENNINIIFKILELIIKNIDPILNDLDKLNNLY